MKIAPVTAFALCVATALSFPSLAQTTTQPSTTQSDIVPVDLNNLYPPPPERAKLDAQLDQPINDFKMDQQPFGQAIDKLRAASKLNITVNWPAIEAAGIDPNTPVNISLHNPTSRTVLSSLLGSNGAGPSHLGYTLLDGGIDISTKDELESARFDVTREYDIDSLIGWAIKSHNESDADAIKEITSVITSTVAPDTWRDAGGTIGSLREWHHILYICQTEDNQEQVRQILAAMAARAMPIIRVYDVRSLIADPDKAQSIGRLMDVEGLIRDQCPPETWGANGAMTARNGFLIISANSLSQDRIAALLDAARKIDAKTATPAK